MRTEISDGICEVALNRPSKLNAISDEMYRSLMATIESAIANSDVKVILLSGEGRSFSSGRDTSQMGRSVEKPTFLLGDYAQRVNQLIFNAPKPVVASLHGHVIGKALEMVLSADFRIADYSVSLCFPEIRYGLVTDNAGATQAAVLAGPSRAKFLLMTGDSIDGEQALSWGLIDRLVGSGELEAVSGEFAVRIARDDPLALALTKQLVNEASASAVARGFRQEMLAQRILLSKRKRADEDL